MSTDFTYCPTCQGRGRLVILYDRQPDGSVIIKRQNTYTIWSGAFTARCAKCRTLVTGTATALDNKQEAVVV